MLDQMFTAENFRRIYDSENRKGLDLASRYFPDLEPHTLAVREKVQEIRALRSKETSLGAEDFNAQLAALKATLVILKATKSAAVDEAMDGISLKVLQPSFKIELRLRTHSQKSTVAARAMADRKTVGHRS